MNLHRAMSDLAEIRAQLDRTEKYRCFRSAAVGISVLVLVVGAWIQQIWVSHPAVEVGRYLSVWIGVAACSGLIAVVEMLIRGRRSESQAVWKLHGSLVRQIAPSLLVGCLLTLLIGFDAWEQQASLIENSKEADSVSGRGLGLMWALPGIWSLIYGLGIFSCQRSLPPSSVWVAIYFIGSGAMVLGQGWFVRELAGWQMLVTFGVGQAFLAYVLFWDLERRREETE